MSIAFIETADFTKKVYRHLNDEDLADLQIYLIVNPLKGDVIPDGGGLRKLRWSRKGKGKRGGARIIYYNRLANGEIWLLYIYSKSEEKDITREKLKLLRKEVPND